MEKLLLLALRRSWPERIVEVAAAGEEDKG